MSFIFYLRVFVSNELLLLLFYHYYYYYYYYYYYHYYYYYYYHYYYYHYYYYYYYYYYHYYWEKIAEIALKPGVKFSNSILLLKIIEKPSKGQPC